MTESYEEDPFQNQSMIEDLKRISARTGEPLEKMLDVLAKEEAEILHQADKKRKLDEALADEEHMFEVAELYRAGLAENESLIRIFIMAGLYTPQDAAEMAATVVSFHVTHRHYGAVKGVAEVVSRLYTPSDLEP